MTILSRSERSPLKWAMRDSTNREFLDAISDIAAGAAESAALSDGLAEVVEAWPDLDASTKASIIALARQSK